MIETAAKYIKSILRRSITFTVAAIAFDIASAHAACANLSVNSTTIVLSEKSLTCEERKLLILDLQRLKSMRIANVNSNLQKLLGLPTVNSVTLTRWLEDRIHYVYKGGPRDPAAKVVAAPATFENESTEFISTAIPRKLGPAAPKGIGSRPKADNVGAELYTDGKNNGVAMMFTTSEGQTLEITTPRVGIISVNGLFNSSNLPAPNNPERMINTIHRLATLFHEARHSDGRGRYATFPHIQCPRGHELQGYPACDDIANGAYAVGVAVDELLVANCHTCTANELANERDAIAHDQVRILKQVPATPETVAAIATGCSRVEAVIQSHNISRAQLRLLERDKRDCPIQLKHWSQPHSAVWADAEPEFLSIDR